MSHDPQSPTDAADFDSDDYDETEECWECSGEGGWNSCLVDCCPAWGGEEECSDPLCWRICPNCKGAANL